MAPAAKAPHPQQPPCQRAKALSLIVVNAATAQTAIAPLRAKLPIVVVMWLSAP
jgi:hypothetical protein